jgi:DNA-binding transcriptional MocR family regulator
VVSITATRLAGLLGGLAGERPPRYAALAARIRLLIADGRLAVGVRLPAERELASALQLSRATVTAAYRRLRHEGWAGARQGAGTWTSLPAGPVRGAWVPVPPAAGVLDFVHAAPAAPPEIVTAFTAALGDLPRLVPGHGYHPAGLPELRARIAERYTKRGLPTTVEQILITAGALHGITVALLDSAQRARLAAGLHRSGTVALVDETFVELGLDVTPPAPYAAFARADRAVTVGTLSKTFWGGLRIGWLRAETSLVHRLSAAAVRAHLSGPVLEQLAACHLLEIADDALPAHRRRLRVQRDALVTAVTTAVPRWQVPVPPGGLVLWCDLAAPVSNALVDAAERRGLRLAAGPRFGTGHAFADRLRLPYTHPIDTLQRAAEILAEATDTLPQADPDRQSPRLVV